MSKDNIIPFNPLAISNLGDSVARALLNSKPVPIARIEPFMGAGLYAIYYTGNFEAYRELANNTGKGQAVPIYVGKAVPKGARKGTDLSSKPGRALFNRLKQHARSIRAASNLDWNDFECRYLVVDDIWMPLGESLLIARFRPVWNTIVDGFGNHDPGKGRHKGMRPRWDTLHPGREWAEKLAPRDETPMQIAREIREYLRNI